MLNDFKNNVVQHLNPVVRVWEECAHACGQGLGSVAFQASSHHGWAYLQNCVHDNQWVMWQCMNSLQHVYAAAKYGCDMYTQQLKGSLFQG